MAASTLVDVIEIKDEGYLTQRGNEMAASNLIDVEKIKERVWREIRAENFPITDAQREDIDDMIFDCTKKVHSITTILGILGEDAPVFKLEKLLKLYVADDKMNAIKEAFRTETFTLSIVKSGDKSVAISLVQGQLVGTPVVLNTDENVSQTRNEEIGSLILEIIFFLLGLAGIKLTLSKSQLKRIIDEILRILSSSLSFQATIQQFIDRWTGSTLYRRASAIYNFIEDMFNSGRIRDILNIVLHDMSAWDRIRKIAEILAWIILDLACVGLALRAPILLALNDGLKIGEKILNLNLLNELLDEL